MTNIERVFKHNRKCITLYLTLGYPNKEEFFKHVDILVEEGVDILEIGIPVKNPCLDGKTIADTHSKVIGNGFNEGILVTYLLEIRNRYPNLPIAVMSYKEGIDKYSLLDKNNLYDVILCPDQFITTENDNVSLIQIYNEEMPEQTMRERLENNKGFAYVMSGVGITGGKGELPNAYINTIERIKSIADIPIQVGFGIYSPDQVKTVLHNGADGVIIGSEIIRIINNNCEDELRKYVRSIAKVRG